MFIVHDHAVATTICSFYKNPDHVGWRDELDRLGLLDRLEPYAQKVAALTLSNFIKNDRWAGISSEMDKYLPTVISSTQDTGNQSVLSHLDILRAVSVSSSKPIHEVSIKANDLDWFKGKVSGLTEFTIEINPGMPLALLPYSEISVVTDHKPDKVQTANTYLPIHIYKALKAVKQVIVPSQGSDYYLHHGYMETI